MAIQMEMQERFTFDNLALTEANDKPPANAAVLSLNQADDEVLQLMTKQCNDFYLILVHCINL